MPKKKKGKKGKKKASAGKSGPVSSYIPIDIPNTDSNTVTLNMKLVNWSFNDFKMENIRVNAPLFSIINELQQRHGKMKELKIYKDTVNEQNELVGEFSTLIDLGIEGSATGDAVCNVYYDFKPESAANDPLLLANMNSA